MSLKDLLGRVQRLEDIEDIKKLKAGYCAACDRGYQADEIAELFTVDGIWDGGKTFGVCRSREEIRRHFQGASKRLTIARHQVMNPDIRIADDGKSAKGEWLLFQPCTDSKAGAAWLAATYHDTYVKESGRWLFKETIIEVSFFTPYDKGWVNQRFLPGREPEGFKGSL